MWNLYQNEELISPLLYSTGTGQDTTVTEIIEAFESYDVIFLKGNVGSGKSGIALNVANNLGGALIVVPTKFLQHQYVQDYCEGNYKILKYNKEWMKIRLIKGRNNFNCLYDPYFKCNHKSLPCTRTLPKRGGKPVSRLEIASECPFYSPIIRTDLEALYSRELECEFESIQYQGVGSDFSVLRRQEQVCPYYQQYREYGSSDVVLMNSAIWMLETVSLKRKPIKPVEIIDEGDAFLDSLSLKKSISYRLLDSIEEKLIKAETIGKEEIETFAGIKNLFNEITKTSYEGDIGEEEKLFLKQFVEFLRDIGNENSGKYSDILEFLDENYVSIKDRQIEYFIPEPKIVVKKLLDLSAKKMLFMSATFQSEKILENIFGFDNFCFIEGEPNFPGTVYPRKLGTENRVTYKTWKHEEFRRLYWRNLINAIKQSTKPCMIPVHAFKYLPEGIREKLRGQGTLRTKNGNITFSTVMKRGVDLKDDQCRSIVMLKFPFPNTQEPILKAMRLKLGDESFWRYYQDIAKREFIQTIGRGVRHKDDWCEFWSPDRTCLGFLENFWKGEIKK